MCAVVQLALEIFPLVVSASHHHHPLEILVQVLLVRLRGSEYAN